MSTFIIGQIVRLKSGSPDLTVHAIQGDTITVRWFSGTLREHDFNAASLVSVTQ